MFHPFGDVYILNATNEGSFVPEDETMTRRRRYAFYRLIQIRCCCCYCCCFPDRAYPVVHTGLGSFIDDIFLVLLFRHTSCTTLSINGLHSPATSLRSLYHSLMPVTQLSIIAQIVCDMGPYKSRGCGKFKTLKFYGLACDYFIILNPNTVAVSRQA